MIGFGITCILNLTAWISGTTVFSYNRFDWLLIPLLPLVFIQCTAEEMLLRGYVPAVLGEKSAANQSVGIILGKADYNPVFYDEKYGFISAVFTTVLFTALILLLIYILSKRGKLEGYRDE